MIALPPIRISAELSSFIRTLHPILKKRVHAALHEIRSNPDSGKQLQDDLEGYRSFRIGKFRIVYRMSSRKEIEIIAVGPRKTIYTETVLLIAKKEGP